MNSDSEKSVFVRCEPLKNHKAIKISLKNGSAEMDRIRNLRKYGSWDLRSVSGKNIDIFKFPISHIHGFREMERIAGPRS